MTDTPNDIERLARRRAGAKLGWYIHASVYLLVNGLLLGVSLYQGRGWFVFPLLGWGLGLAIHGLVVFLTLPGNSLYARLLARERKQLEDRG